MNGLQLLLARVCHQPTRREICSARQTLALTLYLASHRFSSTQVPVACWSHYPMPRSAVLFPVCLDLSVSWLFSCFPCADHLSQSFSLVPASRNWLVLSHRPAQGLSARSLCPLLDAQHALAHHDDV